MTSFQVGQVVVCIDDAGIPDDREVIPHRPREGGVYTIRHVGSDGERIGLLLEEIRNPEHVEWPDGTVREVGFYARRFRPAKTTSLEVFEAMLAPCSRKTEPA